MVQTLATNVQNDLFIDASGNLAMLTTQQAVATACKSACLTQLGECVLQTGYGLPNFSLIWTGTPDYALWQSCLQQTLLNVPGVSGVSGITLGFQGRILSYAAQVTTVYDPQPILIQGNLDAPAT